MKIKGKIKFIFIFVLAILVILITEVEARYVINKNQTITISSSAADFNVAIDKTTNIISTQPGSTNFKITIINRNPYAITYNVIPSSTKLIMSGGITDDIIEANSIKDIIITASTKTGVYYTEVSESASAVVEITGPYEKRTTTFNLTVTTLFGYDLVEYIKQNNTLKTSTANMFQTNVTTVADSGFYSIAEGNKTSYYFRGVVNNNYVNFAGKIWRLVRINGDGSYRLVLNAVAGQSFFNTANETTYNNIGYMYGTAANTTGTNSSTIKNFLDDWYEANLASYDAYMHKDAIYWNDRSYYTTISDVNYYQGAKRVMDYAPSVSPTVKADMYSVTNTDGKGNGLLSKPIGLLTIDEVMLAGGKLDMTTAGSNGTHIDNTAYYLYTSDATSVGFWTMTPKRYKAGNGYNLIFLSKPHAVMYAEPTASGPRDVRPVINLKPTVKVRGTGISTDPYVIQSVE